MPKAKSVTPTDEYVGERIKQQRMLKGLSQSKLGEHLGLTFQQVQKYETGRNRVSAGKLQATANLLGVPVGFFFDGGPDVAGKSKVVAAPWGDLLSTRDGIDLCTAFAKIKSAALRRKLVSLIEEMTAK